MAPLHEIAFHLIGCLANELVALWSVGHVLQSFEELEDEAAIVLHRNLLHRIAHGLGLGGYFLGLGHIEGIVDVELEVTHDGKKVPKLLLLVGSLPVLWRHAPHNGYNGFGTALALCLGFQSDGIVDHILYLTPIFGQNEFLALGVIV